MLLSTTQVPHHPPEIAEEVKYRRENK